MQQLANLSNDAPPASAPTIQVPNDKTSDLCIHLHNHLIPPIVTTILQTNHDSPKLNCKRATHTYMLWEATKPYMPEGSHTSPPQPVGPIETFTAPSELRHNQLLSGGSTRFNNHYIKYNKVAKSMSKLITTPFKSNKFRSLFWKETHIRAIKKSES